MYNTLYYVLDDNALPSYGSSSHKRDDNIGLSDQCHDHQTLLETAWWGMRDLTLTLQQRLPSAYGNTIAHFETSEPVVALSIDDGLSRGGPATSMAAEVQELLQKYQAHATFFVCTDYIQAQEEAVQDLLGDGHELGNHLQSDRSFYYSRLSEEDFQRALVDANTILNQLDHGSSKLNEEGSPIRWFRAPQGVMTASMRQIVEEQGNVKHVLGDCYCDDWRFAEQVDSNDNPDTKRQTMKQVAELMLAQAQPGSIAIFHMPEQGFRQATIYALEYFLQALQEKGWRCVNLSEMHQLCRAKNMDERHRDS